MALTPPGSLPEVGVLRKEADFGVFEFVLIHLYMLNSLIIALATTAVALFVGSLAGYTFGRLKFKDRAPLTLILLAISYFPQVAFLLPFFRSFTGKIKIFGVSTPVIVDLQFVVIIPLSTFLPVRDVPPCDHL